MTNQLKLSAGQLTAMLAVMLLLVTVLLYWQVKDFDFIHYDDYPYVVENTYVNSGVTLSGIIWAFTGFYESNWYPLTWLSHMIDVELYGLDPAGHHVTNMLFHLCNSLLLFLLLILSTQQKISAFLVAMLFAIHPMHIESVAWVAERKDVLSTFFFLLTLFFYVAHAHAHHRRPVYWFAVWLFMVFAFMSKSMTLTLPFVMLIMDWWPLQRLGSANWRRLLAEKVPFFLLATVVALITYMAQKQGGALTSGDVLTWDMRLQNALVSYKAYIDQFFLPANQSIFYPHPHHWPMDKVLLSGMVLVSITIIMTVQYASRPYLIFGWLFFLGTLVPVIGVVQTGAHAMADRYTYIPYIGLAVMLSYFVADMAAYFNKFRTFLIIAMFIFVSFLLFRSTQYLPYWKDDVLLFSRALKIHDPGYETVVEQRGKVIVERQVNFGLFRIYHNLGVSLYKAGHYEFASIHFGEASRINPAAVMPYYLNALALEAMGEFSQAYQSALAAKNNNLKTSVLDDSQLEQLLQRLFPEKVKEESRKGNLNAADNET